MKVKIPFMPYFAGRLLEGRKTATTRTKPFGKPGDTFEAFGLTFIILEVREIALERVAYEYYHAEGFYSVEGFIECWASIHPRLGYQPRRLVYLHEFQEAT